MKLKMTAIVAVAMLVAGCEPERGVGFTGIGSQSDVPAYSLTVQGLTATKE